MEYLIVAALVLFGCCVALPFALVVWFLLAVRREGKRIEAQRQWPRPAVEPRPAPALPVGVVEDRAVLSVDQLHRACVEHFRDTGDPDELCRRCRPVLWGDGPPARLPAELRDNGSRRDRTALEEDRRRAWGEDPWF